MGVSALIVDDSPQVRTLLRRRLELCGIQVVAEAGDAAEGLELFRSQMPNVVTLDLMMPMVRQMDAKSLFQTIRTESPGTAIVVVSAKPKGPEAASFINDGAVEYLQKPFVDFAFLAAKLESIFPELKHGSGS
jgi:CheY-like chemotaxis protein